MKKLLIVLLICLNVSICFAGQGFWKETTCEICGKQVYVWVEESDWNSGLYITTEQFIRGLKENAVRELSYKATMQVCESCYEKYNATFKESMNSYFNEWKCAILKLNKDSREENQKKNSERRIEEIKTTIKELKEKIKEIKGE